MANSKLNVIRLFFNFFVHVQTKRRKLTDLKISGSRNRTFWLQILILSFFKWTNPGLFLYIFGLFRTNNSIFATNQCQKCPSSIWRRDSNPLCLEHESSPITTRPGLPVNPSFSGCDHKSWELRATKTTSESSLLCKNVYDLSWLNFVTLFPYTNNTKKIQRKEWTYHSSSNFDRLNQGFYYLL